MTTPGAVDLFGGAGGWTVACERLGIAEVGIELNASACATRDAAAFATIRMDLHSPRIPYAELGAVQLIPGLIASPPCQTFSRAGGGNGRVQLDLVTDAL